MRAPIAVSLTVAVAALCAGNATRAGAAPATEPARDTVVETVLAPREIKAQLARLQAGSTDGAADRAAGARRLIAAARASGDPRLLGYAESQLGAADDVESLVLRATIAQSQHRFDVARALLDEAVRRAPAHPQARLTRASVAQVQGRHAAALQDCAALAAAAPTAAETCTAISEAASGAADRALQRLAAAARDARVRGWAQSVAGEVQLQLGRPEEAAATLRRALASADDLYTRVALGDALLAAGKPAEAERALEAAPAIDAVLLRRWQSAQRLAQPKDAQAVRRAEQRPETRPEPRAGERAEALAKQLAARFASDAARGTPLHAREAARFALEQGRAADALRLARLNWASQRESADALLLADAARASRDATALAEVRSWITSTGLQDARITPVLDGSAP